jgi:hypothetical protein
LVLGDNNVFLGYNNGFLGVNNGLFVLAGNVLFCFVFFLGKSNNSFFLLRGDYTRELESRRDALQKGSGTGQEKYGPFKFNSWVLFEEILNFLSVVLLTYR